MSSVINEDCKTFYGLMEKNRKNLVETKTRHWRGAMILLFERQA
jgi:hypothetical protein